MNLPYGVPSSLQQAFPCAVVALAWRAPGQAADQPHIFKLALAGNAAETFGDVAAICQRLLSLTPTLPLNQLLQTSLPQAWSQRQPEARHLLRQAGYSNLIINAGRGADASQHAAIALDVCADGLRDAARIAAIERTFLAATGQVFAEMAERRPAPPAAWAPAPPPLTRREQDILAWLKVGKSNWVISQIIGISEHTVKHMVSSILKKYGVISRYHLLDAGDVGDGAPTGT